MAVLRMALPLCAMLTLFAASTARAGPPSTLSSEIRSQPLAGALVAFGRQTGLQVIYVAAIAEGQRSNTVPAGLAPREALVLLLDGTGLTFEFLNARTVGIVPVPVTEASAVTPAPARRYTVRQAESNAPALEEIVVTATRREESIGKVPISMAVWTREAMEASRVKGIEQIGALTPGVDFSTRPGIDIYSDLSIRGVSNRNGTSVGVYLDDTQIPPAR